MNVVTDWASAVAILAAGLLVGVIVFFAVRRKASTIDTNLDRKDLEAKRDALIAQLRALPDDAVDERARLERETAAVLRQLDSAPSVPPTPIPQQPTPTTINPAIKGFLWGAGSFAALAALAYFVMQSATPREQQAAPMAQQTTDPHPQVQSNDPQVLQLEAAVQRDPNNLALRNDLAQAYLERENLMAVFDQTKFVLEKNPNDSRALTFQALVRVAMGEADTAMRMLQQAIQSDPRNLDARVSLAWLYTQNNDLKSADATIAEAIQASPKDRARLEEVLQQMKAQAKGQPAPAAQPQPASAAPPAGKSVRVTVSLAGAAPSGGVLFVIARNPAGGPPAAVKRIAAASFPITVEISQADSMMGQPLPDRFRLEARLDSDGDPLTKPPTDPSAALDDVTPGTAVTLALK
jgi:tetratricopeptide (TPR) repeat protein